VDTRPARERNALGAVRAINLLSALRARVIALPRGFPKSHSGAFDPAYTLTQDGYTLLAMGFTGKRALAFKLAYIEAFNRMEEVLRSPRPTLSSEGQAQGELALDPTDAAQMQSARQAALDYFDKAQAAVKGGARWFTHRKRRPGSEQRTTAASGPGQQRAPDEAPCAASPCTARRVTHP